jgi:hypothetical protein
MLSAKQEIAMVPSYQDLLSPFVVIFERDGIELARQTVQALDEQDASGDIMGVMSEQKLDIFDKTISWRFEVANADRT